MIPTSVTTPVARPSFDKRGLRFEMDGRLLRAFRADFAPFYRSLMESPDLEKLFEAGLVRTWISDVEIPGFDLVLESERLPIVSYPLEWPTAMLHEAALVTARLARPTWASVCRTLIRGTFSSTARAANGSTSARSARFRAYPVAGSTSSAATWSCRSRFTPSAGTAWPTA